MMRIFYFSRTLPLVNARFIWDELDHFSATHSIIYLSVTESATSTAQFHVELVPFEEALITRKLKWKLWQLDLRCRFENKTFKKELARQISAFKPDIIHCHFAYEALMLADNFDNSLPVIFHFHGYDASQMLRKRSYIERLKHYAGLPNYHFIYCSKNIEEKLSKAGIRNASSHVLYYGIDLDYFQFQQHPLPKEPLTFLHVSRLQEKKGMEYSLRAFEKVLRSGKVAVPMRFVVVGEGELKTALMVLCNSLRIEQYVEFTGMCTNAQVKDHLSRAHVFVHHSITAANGDQEGIPNAIMEAMAIGMPVLSSYHSGIHELVDDGIHGYLSPEKDVDDIADKMIKISEWKEFRLRACRQRIENRFNKTKHIAQLEAIYQKIIAGN